MNESTPPLITVKCMVVCRDARGILSLFPVRVQCTQHEVDEGGHRTEAREAAEMRGYHAIGDVFDQDNPTGRLILDKFDWAATDVA